MNKFLFIIYLISYISITLAQPLFLRGDFGAGWNDYQLIDRGVVSAVNINATVTNAATGFVFTHDLSYNPKWCGSTTDFQRVLNQKLIDAAYYYTTGNWDNNLNISTTTGKYYTFITSKNTVVNNNISILETDFYPADIINVTQNPALVLSLTSVNINVTLSGLKNSAEKIFIRWSNDNWVSSAFNEITVFDENNTGSAIIPGQTAGTIISYYAFSTTHAAPSASDIDYYTLKINNYANMNYSYVVSQTSGCPISVYLGNDTSICGMGTLILEPDILISPYGDSLIITYNATQGQTGLAGAAKVYMHAAAELHTNGGWQFTKGNWGMDDGVGEMTNIGSNTWRIKINPVNYFGYPADSILNGLLIVFRNENGTLTGKDAAGNDIWINMKSNPPVSSFSGVSPLFLQNPVDSVIWSDGSHSNFILASTTDSYWIKVFNTSEGCNTSDTIHVSFGSIPYVNIGNDQGHCTGDSVILNAGNGFSSYIWSTGATSQQITVNTTGTYSVTVSDNGCNGFDFVHIEFVDPPLADFSFIENGLSVTFTDLSVNAVNYFWDFQNNGSTESTVTGNVTWNYLLQGQYTVRLTVGNACDTSIHLETIFVTTGIENNSILPDFTVFPTITKDNITVNLNYLQNDNINLVITNLTGMEVIKKNYRNIFDEFHETITCKGIEAGVYILKIQNGKSIFQGKIIKTN